MKYLNVAEKNDAAKNIANQLSNGSSQRVNTTLFFTRAGLNLTGEKIRFYFL